MFRIFRRGICVLLTALILILLAGCRQEESVPDSVENADETITVYATFYPLYALTEMIISETDGIRTLCLTQPQDGCLRNYELSDWDMALILRSADVVISGGRGLESFESTLFALGDYEPAVSAVLYNMELDSTSVAGLSEDEESHWENNPHIYMSIDGAIVLTQRIAAAMQTLDPDCADVYSENQVAAEARLNELKVRIAEITGDVSGIDTAILNEAIWYLAKDFGLEPVLCYHHESGENIDNIDRLVQSLQNSGAKLVLIEKQAPYAAVETLRNAGFAVAEIDILSTHRADEGADGYFDAQIANAIAIKTACETIE